ncbi:restriction endonuclease [Agrobacterium sp. S2]|nr:restriction endonuclease [Agrobacterium sp. S2]
MEAAVRVAGETLYWKRSLKRLLRTSGATEAVILRYEALSKYQILRGVWGELDGAGERGLKVQKRIVAALANLDAPEPRADQRAGQEALDELRRVSQANGLLVDPDEHARQLRREEASRRAEERDARAERLATLASTFRALHSESNSQARGYAFERLLADLFRMYELDFRGSYKTDIDQVDGALQFEAFTYLLEARWRGAPAVASDLVGLTGKVERRIESTRGLFVSMAGFRTEVASMYRLTRDQRLVLMDGQDLALIFEGRSS